MDKTQTLPTMISDRQKGELRKTLEMQFRYQFYQDLKFPFLQSMGCKHVFQAFSSEETGDLGILHLYWTPVGNGIEYEGTPSYPEIKGMWKAEWYDEESKVIELVSKLFEGIKIDKMHMIHEEFRQRMFMDQKSTELLEKLDIPQHLLN